MSNLTYMSTEMDFRSSTEGQIKENGDFRQSRKCQTVHAMLHLLWNCGDRV